MQDKVEKKSNEDGSRGLNQDDSGGKNQDQDSKGASLRNNQMSSSSYSTPIFFIDNPPFTGPLVELRTFPDIIDPPVEVREMLPTGNFNAPIMEAVP
jgi:hypothetical protein